jgi:hypothetical protein
MPASEGTENPRRSWILSEDFDQEKLEDLRAERRMREERFKAQLSLLSTISWLFFGLVIATFIIVVLDAVPALQFDFNQEIVKIMAYGTWGEIAGLLIVLVNSIFGVRVKPPPGKNESEDRT